MQIVDLAFFERDQKTSHPKLNLRRRDHCDNHLDNG